MSLKKPVIQKQLNRLEYLYSSASNSSDIEHQKYYSKLALLECAGWVEESMDVIARKSMTRRRVRNRTVIDYMEDIIKHNYGFGYEKNFKSVLCRLIGAVEFNKVEKSVDPIILSNLIGALETLKAMRDVHAHTYILNTSAQFYSPSWVLSAFKNLYNGLVEFHNKI